MGLGFSTFFFFLGIFFGNCCIPLTRRHAFRFGLLNLNTYFTLPLSNIPPALHLSTVPDPPYRAGRIFFRGLRLFSPFRSNSFFSLLFLLAYSLPGQVPTSDLPLEPQGRPFPFCRDVKGFTLVFHICPSRQRFVHGRFAPHRMTCLCPSERAWCHRVSGPLFFPGRCVSLFFLWGFSPFFRTSHPPPARSFSRRCT